MSKFILGMSLLMFVLSGCNGMGFATPTSTATVVPTATPMPPTSTPEPTATSQPECATDSRFTFTDYKNWIKVNPKPILGHRVYVNIYVNDLAKDIYLSASGETFPVCAEIVKTHLLGADSDTVTALTVMVKMSAGYDPEYNDWYWGMYDMEGKVAQMSGKVQFCIDCHQPVADTDYVFSNKVMEETQK